MSEPEHDTVRRTAERLGISRELLYQAIRAGELKAYKPGRRWIYLRLSAVSAWLDENAVQPVSSDVAARVDRSLRRDRVRARSRK